MPRKKRTNKLFTLDTETYGLGGALKRIAIYDGKEVTFGYRFADVEWVLNKAHQDGFIPHVYIHNLDFDARKLDGLFERDKIVWERTKIIGRRYAIITTKNYVLHDSFKLLPDSLERLSKSFQLEHGKMDLWEEVQKTYPGQYTDKVDFFNRCDPDDPVYVKYLGFDVISLYELIEKLIDVSGIEFDDLVKCMSTASMSKYVLKNGFKGLHFKFKDCDKTDFDMLQSCKAWASDKTIQGANISYREVENKIRAGYYGGRTEVFTPHVKPIPGEVAAYHYDVNSLYPSVMHGLEIGKADFPIGYPEYYEQHSVIAFKFSVWQKWRHGLGFIKAHVYVPKQYVPPLPVKKGRLVFMTGHLVGTWTYNELDYAIRECGVQVIEFQEMIHFQRTHKVFHNFIEVFSHMKEEAKEKGEAALVYFTKLLQNTAYGWTGMNRDDKTEFKGIEKLEKYEERIIDRDEELGFIEIISDVRSFTIQVQVAAYVTSYARLVLLDMLRKQAAKGTLYYCDTDSIVCSAPLDPEYIHHSQLGKWDLEAEIFEAFFVLPKIYTEIKKDDKPTIKFKGVTKATQKNLTPDFYADILQRLKDGNRESIEVEHGKELLRSLIYTQKNNLDPNLIEFRDKQLHLGNRLKRKFDFNSNRSEPWHMENLIQFEAFNFKEDLTKYELPDGSLFSTI